jgi:cytochrome b6-f complex iron-sulfur subunit
MLVAGWGAGAPALAQYTRVQCADCHAEQGAQFVESVHAHAITCDECHGGEKFYTLPADQDWRLHAGAGAEGATPFDHGARFRGKLVRVDVPTACGTCHSDVARMNPYGLRTDQLAAYRLSGHGRRLAEAGDDRVAVCIDCHGAHDVLRVNNPKARTYFQNIPDTCGRCHGDPALMSQYQLPVTIVEQYRDSIHGRNVLAGDAGSPNCATCHGSHAAAPPGFSEVGHVCARCHAQIEEHFSSNIHSRLPLYPYCVGCHAEGGQRWNHQIQEASPTVEQVTQAYDEARRATSGDSDALRAAFRGRLEALAQPLIPKTVCTYCHDRPQPEGHAKLLVDSDRRAMDMADRLTGELEAAQLVYARAFTRVDEMSRGVLLVTNEALRVEDAKTELMSLYAFLHTLDLVEIQKRVQLVRDICGEVHTELDMKDRRVFRRKASLAGAWGVIGLFFLLMYRKHLQLKQRYVRLPVLNGKTPAASGPLVPRRRMLDLSLKFVGGFGCLALAWPAIAYVLPARKRAGGSERVDAGEDEGWAIWELRKISLGGKPAGVLRTDKDYRAFSLVCTHLGCIVHWDGRAREFICPCHAARFGVQGEVLGGPPPKPLPKYTVAVVQGNVMVSASAPEG